MLEISPETACQPELIRAEPQSISRWLKIVDLPLLAKVRKPPVLFLVVCVLAYGLLVPWLGYYADDWVVVWVSHTFGRQGLMAYHSYDRPALGWLNAGTLALLGESPIVWHIFAVIVRWLSAVAVWWCLRVLWPQRRNEATGTALLFAVYPGFTLLPLAITISDKFLSLGLVVFSLGAMIGGLRRPRSARYLTVASLISQVVSEVYLDYFVGLEFLRPCLLWLVLGESIGNSRQRFRRVMAVWSPYLGVTLISLFWRLLIFKSARADTNQMIVFSHLVGRPIHELGVRAYFVVKDAIQACFVCWAQTLSGEMFRFDNMLMVASGLTVVASTAICAFWFLGGRANLHEDGADRERSGQSGREMIVVGLLGVVFGGLPIWFSGRSVTLMTFDDRYTLPMMFGACVLMIGVLGRLSLTVLQRRTILAILVGLGAGFHFRNADRFRHYAADQNAVIWQLKWRAPDLKPGTSILMDQLPTFFWNGYSLTPNLNLAYRPERSSTEATFWFFRLSRDLGFEVPALRDNVRVADEIRMIRFVGSTSNSLSVWYSPPGCLRVLDPSRDDIPQLPTMARAARAVSHLDQIITDADGAASPAAIFGAEPKHCWCYYFEKAELARQMRDWEQVTRFGDEVRKLGLTPGDATEWIPFVEGYIHAERYEDARQVCQLAIKGSKNARDPISKLIIGIEGPDSTARAAFVESIKGLLSESRTVDEQIRTHSD